MVLRLPVGKEPLVNSTAALGLASGQSECLGFQCHVSEIWSVVIGVSGRSLMSERRSLRTMHLMVP